VLAGNLRCRTVQVRSVGKNAKLRVGDKEYPHSTMTIGTSMRFTPEQTIVLAEEDELRIEASA